MTYKSETLQAFAHGTITDGDGETTVVSFALMPTGLIDGNRIVMVTNNGDIVATRLQHVHTPGEAIELLQYHPLAREQGINVTG